GMAPIVLHAPRGTGGRRMTIRGEIIGVAYSDADVVEFLRQAGRPDGERALDDHGGGGGRGGLAHEYGAACRRPPGEGGVAQSLGNLVEATPAVFAGAVFALFGLGLLVWTAVRARHRRPVYEGAAPGRSATVAASVAVASLALGLWCFSRV
ncbi:hypothetical protein, partial [Streptomyces albidoflavus]|uniref:hypothetical protein n=1 Tax=Streptomyces albidoflavus TaxID=1886 RepID=UPI00211BE7E5